MAETKKGKGATAVAELPVPTPRLKQLYDEKLRAELKETLGLANIMQVPRVEKIVVSMGVGAAITTGSLLDNAQRDMTLITGQKPIVTRAKKSIAGFKLREGQAIGCKVTLRNIRMYEFLDRLVSLAHSSHPRLPRPADEGIRRPRQLHLRRHRTAHLPRDRIRQDRCHSGNGHHNRHQREYQRTRQGVARCIRLPVPT